MGHSDLFLDPGLDRSLISKDDFHLKRTDCFIIRGNIYKVIKLYKVINNFIIASLTSPEYTLNVCFTLSGLANLSKTFVRTSVISTSL